MLGRTFRCDVKKSRRNSTSETGDLFKKLGARSTSKTYRNGQPIFSEGDSATAIYCVESGNVKMTVAGKGRNKASLAILRAGDCFGENCLAGESLRTCTATSIQTSSIGRTTKKAMLKRLRDEPPFEKIFPSYLLFRISRFEDDLLSQLKNPREKRPAPFFLQPPDTGDDSRHSI